MVAKALGALVDVSRRVRFRKGGFQIRPYQHFDQGDFLKSFQGIPFLNGSALRSKTRAHTG